MTQQILGPRDLSSLNKSLSALNDAIKVRDRLKAAGIDTSEMDGQITYLTESLEAIKREFFPTQG